jgi:flavin-dependent dehydrogenase
MGGVDVIVAGAGVAGSSLAILLGRAGVSVELYDQHRFPRDKVCAEGLMPAGVGVLGRLGLAAAAGGAPFRGIRYFGHGRQVEALFPGGGDAPGHGLGLRRLALDALLFETARATPGVTALPGVKVEAPLTAWGRVTGVLVDGRPRRARLVVAADGPRSLLRRRLGLDPAPPRRPRIGLRAHFRLAPGQAPADHVEIFLGDEHELYVTPVGAAEVSVALLAARAACHAGGGNGDGDGDAPGRLFRRAIAQQPRLCALLEGARPAGELGGRTPLAGRARRGVVPGLVLLGDAAAALDPVTGAGMAQALVSAELLARALVRRDPAGAATGAAAGAAAAFDASDDVLLEFDRRRQALYREAAVLASMVLSLVRSPPLARGAFHLLHHWPALFTHLVGVAGGTRPLLPG